MNSVWSPYPSLMIIKSSLIQTFTPSLFPLTSTFFTGWICTTGRRWWRWGAGRSRRVLNSLSVHQHTSTLTSYLLFFTFVCVINLSCFFCVQFYMTALLLGHDCLYLFIVCRAVVTTKLQRCNQIKKKHKEVLPFFYVNDDERQGNKTLTVMILIRLTLPVVYSV